LLVLSTSSSKDQLRDGKHNMHIPEINSSVGDPFNTTSLLVLSTSCFENPIERWKMEHAYSRNESSVGNQYGK
jgi:hypothetical protein